MSRDEMLSSTERAILRTIVYSSLFEWPLTKSELHRNLMELPIDGESMLRVYQSSEPLQRLIEHQDGYFFLRGREGLIRQRERRQEWSRQVLQDNAWVLKLVASVPFTRLVAISGSAAHRNMDRQGDIDLFLIAEDNRVWTVAVTTLILTRLLRRRKLVCFNFVLSEKRMPVGQKDLFIANQIIHLEPLIGSEVHERFLESNPFVSSYYPNFERSPAPDLLSAPALPGLKAVAEHVLRLGSLYEHLCRRTYSWYLKRKSAAWKTPEEVVLGSNCLKLHTNSHRRAVLERFEQALESALEQLD